MIRWLLLSVGIVVAGVWLYLFLTEDKFEKVPRDLIEIPDYPDEREVRDPMHEELIKDGIRFKPILKTSNPISPMSFTEDYWVVVTGVSSLDAGLKYFYTPTYSKIVVISRKDRGIVLERKFYEDVANVIIKDGCIYFVYGGWFGYKLGRFRFDG